MSTASTSKSSVGNPKLKRASKRFKYALQHNECDVVVDLLAEGYVPDPSSIWIVCAKGNVNLLTKLLRYPMNIQEGMEAAVQYNHIDVLNHLYLAGGDVNLPDEDGKTLLHHVRDMNVCQWLLDMGAKQVPNKDG